MSAVASLSQSFLHLIHSCAVKFAVNDQPSTIFHKAAEITASELVAGDFLEFGVFRGKSFVLAYKAIKEVYYRRILDLRSYSLRRLSVQAADFVGEDALFCI